MVSRSAVRDLVSNKNYLITISSRMNVKQSWKFAKNMLNLQMLILPSQVIFGSKL